MMAAARWPARSEPANNQLDLPMAIGLILFSTQFVVRRQIAVVDVARERVPAFQAVVDRPGRGRAVGHPLPLSRGPLLQGIDHLARSLLSCSPSFLRLQLGDLAFDGVEFAEELQRLLADLAAMIGPELVELAPRVTAATGTGPFTVGR